MLSRVPNHPDLQSTPAFRNAKFLDLKATTPHPQITEWIQNRVPHAQLSLSLGPSHPTQFERALQMLIQNILKDPDARFLALSKSWADYPSPSRYDRHPLSLSSVIAATEFLSGKNWIVLYPGSKQSGLCTRIEPTAELWKELGHSELLKVKLPTHKPQEVLLLRNEARELVDYDDTQKTQSARRNLHQINSFLEKHMVLFQGQRLQTGLVRIFKDSFLQGGRFYRAEHMTLKSGDRESITINGEEICELDFSCLHVNMLYIQATGHPYEGDAYACGDDQQIPRDVYKILLQIILNCKSEFSAVLAANQALVSRGFKVSAEKAIANFLKKHSQIKKYFFTGVGLSLQYQDSVIAEKVLLKAIQSEIPVLPVHDSFLCPKADAEWLKSAMTEASKEVLGTALPFKQKGMRQNAA